MAFDVGQYGQHPVAQIPIDRVVHARAHREPTADSKKRHNERQAQKVPDGETKLDRKAVQSAPSRMRYPIPRSVWMSLGMPGRSTLLRRNRIKTSRLLSLISRSP